jgi:hypothetical protein
MVAEIASGINGRSQIEEDSKASVYAETRTRDKLVSEEPKHATILYRVFGVVNLTMSRFTTNCGVYKFVTTSDHQM